jgi:hypothetical protein
VTLDQHIRGSIAVSRAGKLAGWQSLPSSKNNNPFILYQNGDGIRYRRSKARQGCLVAPIWRPVLQFQIPETTHDKR